MGTKSKAQAGLLLAKKKGYHAAYPFVFGPSGKPLKLMQSSTGYPSFSVKELRSRRALCVMAHRLVAIQKYGESSVLNSGIQVRHLNGDKKDFSWDNIGIGTPSDNMNDIPKNIRMAKAINASRAIRALTDAEILEIKSLRESGVPWKEIIPRFKCSRRTAFYAVKHKYITHV